MGPLQMGPIQMGPIQMRPIQMGPIQMGPIQMGQIQMGPIRVTSRLEKLELQVPYYKLLYGREWTPKLDWCTYSLPLFSLHHCLQRHESNDRMLHPVEE